MQKNGINKLFAPSLRLWGTLFLVLNIGSLAVFPRLLSLESHWSSDETLWLARSRYFIQSLQDGNLKETIISPHPGVTTMWLGGASLWLRYKGNLAVAANLTTKPFYSPQTLVITRTSVVSTTIITILIAWYLLFRLLGWWKSSLATLFIAVDPFYLALSRMLHTDALATSFTLPAVLFLLVYLEQSQRSRYVIFSGICFSLACLSKVTALVLVPYLPLLLGFYKMVNAKRDRNRLNFSILYLYLTWMGTAFLTAICLWPGLWTLFGGTSLLPFFGFVLLLLGTTCWSHRHIQLPVGGWTSQPKHFIMNLLMIALLGAGVWKAVQPIAYGVNLATTPHEAASLFMGKIVHDPGLLFYPIALSVRSLLFTYPLLILGLVWYICHHERSEDSVRRIFFALLMLIPIFIVSLSFAAKKMTWFIFRLS